MEAFHAGATALFGLERKKKEETGGAFRRKVTSIVWQKLGPDNGLNVDKRVLCGSEAQ